MSTTRLQLRTRAKAYFAELVTEFPDATIDTWLEEGHRRLSPILLCEKVGTVVVGGSPVTEITLPTGCVIPLRLWATAELPEWREFGGKAYFISSVPATTTVNVEYLGSWDDLGAGDSGTTPLADWQTDCVVFYAVARGFREYATGRLSYKKFSTQMDGRVSPEQLEDMANFWQAEFERARVECRSHRQLLYEAERTSGARLAGDGL